MSRHALALTLVCGLWLLLGSSGQLLAGAAELAGQEPGRQSAEDSHDQDRPDTEQTQPGPGNGWLESRQLVLGGMFIGYVDVPPTRPVPNTPPSHEEMKAATTPQEFRTPPAVSFGWSFGGRR